jgi:cytochrome c-type biogenesis protein CcmH
MMKRYFWLIWIFVLLVLAVPFTLAQEGNSADDDGVITDDEVNALARRMYCPVCENEPLDICGTPTCIEWREEISRQLAQGRSEEEIVSYFVRIGGQQVSSVPTDPFLRGFSLITPWLIGLIVVGVALFTLWRWRAVRDDAPTPQHQVSDSQQDDDGYRARLEGDL